MKLKIYFLEIDLSNYLYGVYNYINNMINQFFNKFFQKVFCQFTNGLIFESEIWETANSMVSLVYNHY